jgi:hypothetical protein
MARLAGALLLNSGCGLAGCTAASSWGWTIPLLAGIVAGGVAWLLLADDRKGASGGSRFSAECSGCGRAVSGEWRMCPYCGALNCTDTVRGVGSSIEEPLL